MKRQTNFDVYLTENLKDPILPNGSAGEAWDGDSVGFLRKESVCPKKELAKRGTSQQQISRLESPAMKATLSMLRRVVNVLGAM
jgi:hypothetical protein